MSQIDSLKANIENHNRELNRKKEEGDIQQREANNHQVAADKKYQEADAINKRLDDENRRLQQMEADLHAAQQRASQAQAAVDRIAA